MQKFEMIQSDVDELKASIKKAKNNSYSITGINAISNITIRRGKFYYRMSIIYCALLVEYMEEQLTIGKTVDIALYEQHEWLEMEEQLEAELKKTIN